MKQIAEPPPSHPLAVSRDGDGEAVFVLLDVARSIQERVESTLDHVGLSTAKYLALDVLVKAGEPLTLGELAQRLRCVRSNITQLLDRLEADGLVRRVEHPSDRRAVRAMVTRRGAERQARGARAMARLQAELAARAAPLDRELFHRVLCALR